MKEIVTNSREETITFAQNLAKEILAGKNRVIALYGDLGSGKTTFVQGLAEGLGIKKRIISPTFIIVRSYPFDKLRAGKLGVRSFYHIDLYRIDSKKDLEALGLLEILEGPQNIVAIEWAEKIKHLLPENRIDIYFEYLDEDKREIKYGK